MRPLHISFLLAAAVSYSAPMPYTTLSSWQAAGPQDPGQITFETVAAGQYGPTGSLPSFVLSGFTFGGVGGNLFIYNPVQAWNIQGSGVSVTGPTGTAGSISITFPSAVYGIGFLVASTSGSITAVVNDGSSTSFTITPGTAASPGFWGVRNDVPIVNLTLTGIGGHRPLIDSVVWGGQPAEPPPTNETPEAATAILIGSALLLLPTLRRRFSSPSSPQQFAH